MGQFGPYYRQNKHLVLASGDTLTVYRLKYWTFTEGPPALQVEYEAPFSVSDTAAVRREAFLIWPRYAPYVEAQRLNDAIITATNFRLNGFWPYAWTSHQEHFGLIAHRDSTGRWFLDKDSRPLPAIGKNPKPSIIDVNGTTMAFTIPVPAPR